MIVCRNHGNSSNSTSYKYAVRGGDDGHNNNKSSFLEPLQPPVLAFSPNDLVRLPLIKAGSRGQVLRSAKVFFPRASYFDGSKKSK